MFSLVDQLEAFKVMRVDQLKNTWVKIPDLEIHLEIIFIQDRFYPGVEFY